MKCVEFQTTSVPCNLRSYTALVVVPDLTTFSFNGMRGLCIIEMSFPNFGAMQVLKMS